MEGILGYVELSTCCSLRCQRHIQRHGTAMSFLSGLQMHPLKDAAPQLRQCRVSSHKKLSNPPTLGCGSWCYTIFRLVLVSSSLFPLLSPHRNWSEDKPHPPPSSDISLPTTNLPVQPLEPILPSPHSHIQGSPKGFSPRSLRGFSVVFWYAPYASGPQTFMRLPAAESTHTSTHHTTTTTTTSTMSCEQEFGDGALGVTLTLRLLMHGKVRIRNLMRRTLRDRSF